MTSIHTYRHPIHAIFLKIGKIPLGGRRRHFGSISRTPRGGPGAGELLQHLDGCPQSTSCGVGHVGRSCDVFAALVPHVPGAHWNPENVTEMMHGLVSTPQGSTGGSHTPQQSVWVGSTPVGQGSR